MANLFPPDLWGYVHRYSHQPEPFAHYDPLKAQNLEAMLPTIVLFVTSMSLPEQDTTRKGRVYENAMQIQRN